ncbi:MAG: hypothetical protein A3D96_05255 [Chlamydiae bacterium RIFCSPHIGHO2_12_FULL_44_59]|nr:MAG: hypothetical protein A3C42_06650 [Chlamydiae bacterium RIFCSPHIGHO2_02_FULL_45_9]OGN60221.1 MAG: hypothetical protein A3D96_05255 [Chlamydiae bacterium RIFCSPHIGHO2_12_FULL_44_59]
MANVLPIGVTISGNSITFDNENMDLCIPQEVCEQYGGRSFQTITVTGKKMYLGTILSDLAKYFQQPQSLRLDLWYGVETPEDLNKSKAVAQQVLQPWRGACVLFLCNNRQILENFVIR